MEGLGSHQMWGFSPAFDCVEQYDRCRANPAKKGGKTTAKPFSVLLSQPSDVRHVLQTLAQRRRHARRPIHFYISEPQAEC
eukprot:g34.t1